MAALPLSKDQAHIVASICVSDLLALGGVVVGVSAELIPALFRTLPIQTIARCIGDLKATTFDYKGRERGSAIWLLYKRRYDKDVAQMVGGIDTPEKQAAARRWLREVFPPTISEA